FPFVKECCECHQAPNAYKCHHCHEMVYLSHDETARNYAIKLNYRLPDKPDVAVAKKHGRTVTSKRNELEITRIEAEIEAEKRRRDGPKIPDPNAGLKEKLRKCYTDKMDLRQEAIKMHAQVDKDFPNDDHARAQGHAIIDDFM